MKKIYLLITLISIIALAGCGGGSSSGSSGTGSTTDSTTEGASSGGEVSTDVLTYATFGEALSNAMPAALKIAEILPSVSEEESEDEESSGDCEGDFIDCPYITAAGGGDNAAGEILMRLWGLDYEDECTDELLEDGTCFECADCQTGSVGTTKYIRPTMIEDPESCASISTSLGRYVNFGVDPCFFDSKVADISDIPECATVKGGAVDISSAIPWHDSWGIDQTINFSSVNSESDGGFWWTVNNGESGNEQLFVSLDSNWLHVGHKNVDADTFLFFGSGSPDYYEGLGEGYGVNIAAYAGTLSAIPASFEAIQVRDQGIAYIERMISNGSHLWYQNWSQNDVPLTPKDVADVKDDPSDLRCVEIGDNIAKSMYVPLQDCVESFGKKDIDELNLDSNFRLKIIDMETAGAIDFSTPLTPNTKTQCLEEEAREGTAEYTNDIS